MARTLLSSYAGFAAEWLGWPIFFTVTAMAAIPGLLLLAWLTRRGAATRAASRGSGGPVLAED